MSSADIDRPSPPRDFSRHDFARAAPGSGLAAAAYAAHHARPKAAAVAWLDRLVGARTPPPPKHPLEVTANLYAPHAFHADDRLTDRKQVADDGWMRCSDWFKMGGVA